MFGVLKEEGRRMGGDTGRREERGESVKKFTGCPGQVAWLLCV